MSVETVMSSRGERPQLKVVVYSAGGHPCTTLEGVLRVDLVDGVPVVHYGPAAVEVLPTGLRFKVSRDG